MSEYQVEGLDEEPPALTTLALGVAIRREDRSAAVVVQINGVLYLVNEDALRGLVELGMRGLALMEEEESES